MVTLTNWNDWSVKIILDEKTGLTISDQFNNITKNDSKVQPSICIVHDVICLFTFGRHCHFSSLSATDGTIGTLSKKKKDIAKSSWELYNIQKSVVETSKKWRHSLHFIFQKSQQSNYSKTSLKL